MNRCLAITIAAMLLASCRSSQPTTNPFLRTTVPPPGTGQAAVVVPTEPYSTTAPIVTMPPPPPGTAPVTPAPVSGAPGAPPVMPAVPRGGDKYSPPGGSYMFHQSKHDKPKRAADAGVVLASATEPIADSSTPASTTLKLTASDPVTEPAAAENQVLKLAAPAVATAAAQSDEAQSRGHPLTVGDPDEGANSVRIVDASSSSESAALAVPANAVAAANPVLRVTAGEAASVNESAFRTVDSQPAATARMTAGAPDASATSSTAQFVSAPTAANGSGVVQTAFQSQPAAAAPYAHNADYTELRGRLEYSQSARQWKLRYIPIDGETDQYGGSVVLTETTLLGSYKAGDMVTVQGILGANGSPTAGFSPSYQAHRIERIAR